MITLLMMNDWLDYFQKFEIPRLTWEYGEVYIYGFKYSSQKKYSWFGFRIPSPLLSEASCKID